MPYQRTFIDWGQLLKAQKKFDIGKREIILFKYGVELPITQYLQDYWEKLRKNQGKENYIAYLHQHNELDIFMADLSASKLPLQVSQNV